MRLFLALLAINSLASCMAAKTQTSSPLTVNGESIPDEMLSGLTGSVQTLDANSFKNYSIGEVSTSTSFPKAYIALPILSEFIDDSRFVLNVQGYIQTGSVPTGITMQYAKGHWQTYTGQEITRYEIGLLNDPNAKLDLVLDGFTTTLWEKQTVALAPGKVINPFTGVKVIKLDPSEMKWVASLSDRNLKLINMDVSMVDSNAQRLFGSSITPLRSGPSMEPPKSFTYVLTNRDLSKTRVLIQATYGDATGKITRGQREFRSFEDVFAIK